MIYLNNSQSAQSLLIPKVFTGATGSLSLHIKNTIDLSETAQDVTDLGTSDLYYNISITLPTGTPDGEYEYTLLDGGDILSTGIMVIGDCTNSQSQYNKSIEYEQYTAE